MAHASDAFELPSIVRFLLNFSAIETSETLQSASSSPPPIDQSNPLIRELIAQLRFSKRFIVFYNVVLLVIFFAVAISYWGGRWRQWSKTKGNARRLERGRLLSENDTLSEEVAEDKEDIRNTSGSSSASSSTLGGISSPPVQTKGGSINDEETPLIGSSTSIVLSRSGIRAAHIIKSWLQYQPAPIPIINKTLPSNQTSLAILAFVGLNIFFLFYHIPPKMVMIAVVADRASLLFVVNLPLLYLFAAKNQPIRSLTGYSYESLNIVHRRLGELLCLLAVIHFTGFMAVWYVLIRPREPSLVDFLLKKIIVLGIGAFIAYETLYFTSLGSFRQVWYELFLALHVLLQVAALAFLFFHHHQSRLYVGIALAIFIMDRVIYRLFFRTAIFDAELLTYPDYETVGVKVTIPDRSFKYRLLSSIFGTKSITSGWLPTQHIFLNVPTLEPTAQHILQSHPFTIASRAPLSSTSESFANQPHTLELVVRAQSGFSRTLLHHAQRHQHVKVRLDGPYGSQRARHTLEGSDYVIIVAGGSGIAVTWPLTWSLLDKAEDVESAQQQRSHPKAKKILFVWVAQQRQHWSWVPEPGLDSFRMEKDVTVCITDPTSESGRPDLRRIISDWVLQLGSVEISKQQKFGVVSSGPDGMNRTVRNLSSEMVACGWNVNVEVEKFGW
ncbi:hypothetical protein MMC25_003891 [Agyrium rufum]|nr:hypothetical protein [Agyrium rufum]